MVSFIILNHNNGKIIGDCLDSIMKYSGDFEYEIIVVDNCSTDGSLEMLRSEYGDKIRIFENPVNGCASGRNIGISGACGELLCFFDSDQRAVRENWLGPAMKLLRDHPEIGAVGWTGGWFRTGCEAGPIVDEISEIFDDEKRCWFSTIGYLGTGGMLVRREAAQKAGGFDECYDPAFFEDTDFSLRIRKAGYEICVCTGQGIIHIPHQTTKYLNSEDLTEKNQNKFRNRWSGENGKYVKYPLDSPRKILVLSYYNPFNSGGGQRPLAVVREALRHGAEVVFVFESGSDMENMTRFPLFYHPLLRLLYRDRESCRYKAINEQANGFISDDFILNVYKPDHVISFVPLSGMFELFRRCKEAGAQAVYDQMDKWDAFSSDLYGEAETEYVRTADLCITITDMLAKDGRSRYGVRFLRLPNAVDEKFAGRVSLSYGEVKERCGRERKKILYAGALWPDWFDWGLLEYIIKNCPEYDFVIIGDVVAVADEETESNGEDFMKSFRQYPNVTFTGALLHNELPAYYREANAAIIPFIPNDITIPCSPIKCYEYISAYLPVVSTLIDDIKNLPAVSIAENGENLRQNFLTLLKNAAEHDITKEEYDMMREIAVNDVWKTRYCAIMAALFMLKGRKLL